MAFNDTVLVVRSVTNAIKGQKLLESKGISAYVQRNASPVSREGCGYVLKIDRKNLQTAVGILTAGGIKVVEIQGG